MALAPGEAAVAESGRGGERWPRQLRAVSFILQKTPESQALVGSQLYAERLSSEDRTTFPVHNSFLELKAPMPFPSRLAARAFQQTQRLCQAGPLHRRRLSAKLRGLRGERWEPQALCAFLAFSVIWFLWFFPFCYMRPLELGFFLCVCVAFSRPLFSRGCLGETGCSSPGRGVAGRAERAVPRPQGFHSHRCPAFPN